MYISTLDVCLSSEYPITQTFIPIRTSEVQDSTLRPSINQPLVHSNITKLNLLRALDDETKLSRSAVPRPVVQKKTPSVQSHSHIEIERVKTWGKKRNVPNPSAHNKAIVGPDFDDGVVDEDGEVEGLDPGFAGRRLADVKQTQFAGFAALGDAGGQGFGGAGVGAVDDEGFVGEFCVRCASVTGCYVFLLWGVGDKVLTVVDACGLVLGAEDFEAGFRAAVVAGGFGEVDGCF